MAWAQKYFIFAQGRIIYFTFTQMAICPSKMKKQGLTSGYFGLVFVAFENLNLWLFRLNLKSNIRNYF
jgi:hypothetical protein